MNSLDKADLNQILDHTRYLWEELRGERIFITGGTGFFGCWLLESFLWANRRLNLHSSASVLTRDPQRFRSKAPHLAGSESVNLVIGDVGNFSFPAGDFPFLIHAATESSAKLNSENPLLMLDSIVEGTRHTLEFSSSHKTKKMLFTSSGAIYGKQPETMKRVNEDYNAAPELSDPKSAYAQGKRIAEHLCTLFGQNESLQIKIARCFAFVGPYLPLDIHFAIGNFIRDGLKGGPIVVKGNGTPRRSYLYASDLTIWLWTILFTGRSLRPYNVGSGDIHSISEIAEIVAGEFPAKLNVEVLQKADPYQASEYYVPDVQRAKQELGLRELVQIKEGVNKTIKFYQGL